MSDDNILSNKSIFNQLVSDESYQDNMYLHNLNLKEIDVTCDEKNKTIWSYLKQSGRPCFTFELGDELETAQIAIERYLKNNNETAQYYVFGSNTPGIFSLGGDLELFVNNIRTNDIISMKKYAAQSIDILDRNIKSFNSDIITIGLVQGNALGGGFEFALSFDILVAEKSVKFGLPEILFNLFPGMGAYSFLARKIGRVLTEKMILGGSTYTGEQLYDMGVVDILAEDGEGKNAVIEYIENNRVKFKAEKSIYDARKLISPISKEELMAITNIWADTSMSLSIEDLQKMEKFVHAQKRLAGKNDNFSRKKVK